MASQHCAHCLGLECANSLRIGFVGTRLCEYLSHVVIPHWDDSYPELRLSGRFSLLTGEKRCAR